MTIHPASHAPPTVGRSLVKGGAESVWLLLATIVAAAASLGTAMLGMEPLTPDSRAGFWLLAAGFYAAEVAVVHLRVRHHAHSFSMGEVPLVVGLVAAAPLTLLAAQVVGTGVALAVHRRQAPLKLTFNLGQLAFQSAIAIVVLRGLLATGASLESASGWMAVGFATLIAFGLAVVLINGAMRLSGAELESSEINSTVAFGSVATVMNATLGIVLYHVIVADPIVAIPSVVVPGAVYLGYRGFVSSGNEREKLGWIYEATRLLHEAEDIEIGIRDVLGHARHVFEVERAAVVLFSSGGLSAFRTIVGEQGVEAGMAQVSTIDSSGLASYAEAMTGPADLAPSDPAVPGLDATRPAIAAPLDADGTTIGMLVASSPMSDLRRFDASDLRLLGDLARQVSIGVRNSRLERSLSAVQELTEELGENVAMLQAIAECSRALFMAPDQNGLAVALESVSSAIAASSVFVERNVDAAGMRTSRVVESVGVLKETLDRAPDLSWNELHAVAGWLSAGSVVSMPFWELKGQEKERYRDDRADVLIRLPVIVRGEWLGTVGATTAEEASRIVEPGTAGVQAPGSERPPPSAEPDRTTQVTVLQTLADMIGVAWDRESSRAWLEELVNDLDRRHVFETALIASSQALLADADDQAVTVALAALLEATTADYVYVEMNYEDPDMGLCSRIIHEAQRDEVSGREGDLPWFGGPHADFPEMLDGLSSGRAVHVIASEQTGKAREIYEADGLRSELVLPFYIDGAWAGSVGFADYREERSWSEHEVAALRAAADMIGAYLERRQTLERLGALVRAKDEFIASVSHEVRTPLTAVVGLAEELSSDDGTLGAEATAELIDLIADQSQEVANIIEDLLVAARADTGSIRVMPVAVDLKELVDTELVSGRFVEMVGRGRLAVEVPSFVVWADPTRVRQILRNLITNAMRYGGDDVRITARDRGGRIRLSVVDNGPGIPREDRERVFAPYERAHNRPTQPGSVGLGLTVARRLAELMGGTLAYRYLDGWSQFELTLPAPEMVMAGDPA
ncbi:MAG TPA: GAF domain-containing sensor histidine kinase [Acidimicrobiia bacterium]